MKKKTILILILLILITGCAVYAQEDMLEWVWDESSAMDNTMVVVEETEYRYEEEQSEYRYVEEESEYSGSGIQNEYKEIDAIAPTAVFFINDQAEDDEIIYSMEPLMVRVEAEDHDSGVKSILTYLCEGEECFYDPASYFEEAPYAWEEQSSRTVNAEGTFRLLVRTEDYSGNISYASSTRMILDQSAPTIEIENIEEGSAIQGTVLPVLRVKDENLKAGTFEFTLTCFKEGDKDVSYHKREIEKGELIEIAEFPYDQSWDDVYHLTIRAADLAGNIAQKEITFSVNRFGSSYYIEETLSEKLKQYYLKEAVPLEIHEINVDFLVETSIMIGREETVRYLQSGVDYSVEERTQSQGFHEYIYQIHKEVFGEDGRYYVVLASEDKAQNYNDNRTEKSRIEFAVDTKAPTLVLTGAEDGAQYETERELTLECIENMGLSKVEFLVDGIEQGDGTSDSQKVLLKEKEGWQEIRIRAVDLAGNESEIQYMRVKIGTQEKESEQKNTEETDKKQSDMTEKSTERNTEKSTEEIIDNNKNVTIIVGIFICIAVFALFLKVFFRIIKKSNG